MLILSRRSGESLNLGDEIKITVLEVNGKQVKLGLQVPDDMAVYREEIYLQVQESNTVAANIREEDLLAVADIWKTGKK